MEWFLPFKWLYASSIILCNSHKMLNVLSLPLSPGLFDLFSDFLELDGIVRQERGLDVFTDSVTPFVVPDRLAHLVGEDGQSRQLQPVEHGLDVRGGISDRVDDDVTRH